MDGGKHDYNKYYYRNPSGTCNPYTKRQGLQFLPYAKREDDMKELKISKEAVLEASKKCPDAKEVLKALFPDVFKEEWIDITKECSYTLGEDTGGYFLRCEYDDWVLFHFEHSGIKAVVGHGLLVKVEKSPRGTFRIFLKRASR